MSEKFDADSPPTATRFAPDEILLSHLIDEFGERGERAADYLRSASALLAMGQDALPRQGSLIGYSLREAMKAIPESQADGTAGAFRILSRAVVKARQRYDLAKDLAGPDAERALTELLTAVDELATIHGQPSVHERRLGAVMLSLTGSDVSRMGGEPLSAYGRLLAELDRFGVHGDLSYERAVDLWAECLATLRRLFLPPATRRTELEQLASNTQPTRADLAQLRELVVSENHLQYFAARLTGPAWLDLLLSGDLLRPPDQPGRWVFFTIAAKLKADHLDVVVAALDLISIRWGRDEVECSYLAQVAADLGPQGRLVLLRCLQRHPSSPSIGGTAVEAALGGDPGDSFVQLVVDVLINANTMKEGEHLYDQERLLDHFSDGVDETNFLERIRLLVQKISAVPSDDYGRLHLLKDHASIGQPVDFRDDSAFRLLLRTLLTSIAHVANVAAYEELTDAMQELPDDVMDRARPWLLVTRKPVDSRLASEEIRRALARRSPTEDDLPLIDACMDSPNKLQIVESWAGELGNPPAIGDVGRALATHRVPEEWVQVHVWSAVLPAEVTASWSDVIAPIASVYSPPTRDSLTTRRPVVAEWGHSPIASDDLAAMGVEAATAWIRSWRPTPDDFLVSPRELGRTLESLVKADPNTWAAETVRTASELHHPVYIHHYLRGLATADSLAGLSPEALVAVVELTRSHPWEVPQLGKNEYEFDSDWAGVDEAGIDVLKVLADQRIGFGRHEDVAWGFVELDVREGRAEASRVIDDDDPFARAINRRGTRALEAALSLMSFHHSNTGELTNRHLALLEEVLHLEGTDGADHRAVLAARIGFLRFVATEWTSEHQSLLFGEDAPEGLAQVSIDTALRWGQPNAWLLQNFAGGVRDAVHRDVENSLEHYLVAMLWGLPGYEPRKVSTFLAEAVRVSSAAEALGRLLRDDDAEPDHVALAVQFWELALECRLSDVEGFGWYSQIGVIDNERWADLTLRTLRLTHGRIDWTRSVVGRAAAGPATETLLDLFSLMLRGLQGKMWDSMTIGEAARTYHQKAGELKVTPAFRRLTNALMERGLL